jgi:hypothetical protein
MESQFPDHIAFGSHRGHKYTLTSTDDETTNRVECECGKGWFVANDPNGELGSSEAPE